MLDPTSDVPIASPSEKYKITNEKLIIVMVGLPARGKSYVARKICRYMNWLQHDTKIFNVGSRRRKLTAIAPSIPPHEDTANLENPEHSAGFFDPDNIQARELREKVAMETLEELLHYLFRENGVVAIFDATNSTIQRRMQIFNKVKEQDKTSLHVLFLESQCFDEVLLQSNMRLKLSGPDYTGQDPASALSDFSRRIAMYAKKYVELGNYEEQQGFQYFKMIDVGRKYVMHNISGYLATHVVGYLQQFNLANRQIWFTRLDESMRIEPGGTNGDGLDAQEVHYAATLSRFIKKERDSWNKRQPHSFGANDHTDGSLHTSTDEADKLLRIWTSKAPRSIGTAYFFNDSQCVVEHMGILDEFNTGILEHSALSNQKTNNFERGYRLSHGDSINMTNRLQSVIWELERVTDHVLIIGGLPVIRALLAYFRDMPRDKMLNLDVPIGTLYRLEPKPYGADYKEFVFNSEMAWFDQVVYF